MGGSSSNTPSSQQSLLSLLPDPHDQDYIPPRGEGENSGEWLWSAGRGKNTAGMTNQSYMDLDVSGLREREREIAYMEREIAMKTMNVTTWWLTTYINECVAQKLWPSEPHNETLSLLCPYGDPWLPVSCRLWCQTYMMSDNSIFGRSLYFACSHSVHVW